MVASWWCLQFELIVRSTQKKWEVPFQALYAVILWLLWKIVPNIRLVMVNVRWRISTYGNPFRRQLRINSISIRCIPHRSTLSTRITQFLDFLACSLKGFCVVAPHCMPGGGGVLPYMGYIGTCRGIGCGFWGSRSLNRVSFFTLLFLCPWCGP